ncbi:hypothetical protein D9756_004068 [Leucocoprinus leucothites]|uniref:Major facilitator superfamily (MFS) profile domain-containing protein n=1 Tax=Leucocoprinus leucothites TaxID=201217 RepID=A0A8H5D8X5_9AGAR|nr:hypothetical protein D9756_004068 [Leucoagaricus leucothites]
MPSGIFAKFSEEFHMIEIESVLTLSLFVTGYCVGCRPSFSPLLWGPLSEQYGRRPVNIYPFFIYAIAAALAKTTVQILLFRFIGGVFAAAPLTNSGAVISDIWDAETRGKALALFTLAPFAGPAIGPTVAGFVGDNTSWRWVFWILAIFAFLCWILIIFTMPETYGKAERLRKETGDSRYYAPMEKRQVSIAKRLEDILAKPFLILFREPMLIAITIYMSYVMVFNPRYKREAERLAPEPVPPEFRLEIAMISGPIFAISFFWFAWSSPPHISYWAPLMSGLPMGFSISMIFLSLFNYLIDVYLHVAASALAGSTVLFAGSMYRSLDPRWASSLLGFVALLMVPIPFVFKNMPPMTLQGIVTKVGFMNKTATVTVSRWIVHNITGKRIERRKKFLVHDEKNRLQQDDVVLIRNCPPVSARKRFALQRILESPLTERELARTRQAEGTRASPASILTTLGTA